MNSGYCSQEKATVAGGNSNPHRQKPTTFILTIISTGFFPKFFYNQIQSTLTKFLFSLVFILVCADTTQAQEKLDLTGTWIMTVQTDAGSGSPAFVLKQEAEKITGSYTGQLGDAPVTGTLKGNIIHLEFSIQGNLITYDGTASTSTEMSGKVNLAEMASGTFTGKKKP